ncbi:radical SAM protein [candidate division CSSED10-310 bacterium]|uniref:Radical SAM protein n=1 Tax=candidate division CSSED10-310 bacterium TaxID=2855610 RepID=A0ABV6Z2N8_UNCC1
MKPVKISYLRYWPFVKTLFTGQAPVPPYLIFFVTHRCNARCGHCFNWQFAAARPKTSELTLSEIERIARGYGPLMFLFLTGGEPFIRKDLAEIAAAFHNYCGLIKIQIPSNGYFCDRIPNVMTKILEKCPRTHCSVTLSLDAVGSEHDKIRQVKGLFERVSESYRSLKLIEKHNPLFSVNIEVTISRKNQDYLPRLISFLEQEWGVKNILCPLIRGHPRDPATKEVDIQKYQAFVNQIKNDLYTGKIYGYQGFAFARLATAKDTLARETVLNTILEPREYYPCQAGNLAAVLLANGDVLPCELKSEIMGNLKTSLYSFPDLLAQPKAKEIRASIIKEKCFCTHECFLTTNLLFNPKAMLKIIGRTLLFSARSNRIFQGITSRAPKKNQPHN